jgi:arginyl-tRNA synthetase
MLQPLRAELAERLRKTIAELYGVAHEPVVEMPPRRELGDLALPAALHLARELKSRPRDIAERLRAALVPPPGIERVTVEGAGYLNCFLDRRAVAAAMLAGPGELPGRPDKVVIEHTNINPNKAAHIGHLRNAVLGDVLGRCSTALGYPTEIQNYIDDTGVQLADVVVGFVDLRGQSLEQVAALPEPFDHLCWDLYAEVGRWYEESPGRQELRRLTLHELERGEGQRAEVGRLVARRIVGRHLRTMARLGVAYDLLTRESEILRLHFFDQAFELLRARGAVRLEAEGKNRGCWVMPLAESEEFQGLEDPDKVIVRSDGTVTYVGKDIAYQLWKFGLLGRDFEYRRFETDTQPAPLWETAPGGAAGEEIPAFGRAHRVINVIDARQSYLQRIVRAGLEALDHHDEARRSVHFAYEMVSLSAKTARALGFLEAGEDSRQLEMSGRKGIGVKADDLVDRLEAKSREEIQKRNRELPAHELDRLAHQIARAAVRYFMVKTTTTRVIAFDLEQALNFEGDSGPYLQYSLVRAKNILRRLAQEGIDSRIDRTAVERLPAEAFPDDLWDLVLTAAAAPEVVEKAFDTLELSLVARAAVDLAQKFHALYHRHPILQEPQAETRTARLAMVHAFRGTLEWLCGLLGIPVPERM